MANWLARPSSRPPAIAPGNEPMPPIADGDEAEDGEQACRCRIAARWWARPRCRRARRCAAARREAEQGHARHADAHQAAPRRVLGAGAQRAADGGALQQQPQRGDDQRRWCRAPRIPGWAPGCRRAPPAGRRRTAAGHRAGCPRPPAWRRSIRSAGRRSASACCCLTGAPGRARRRAAPSSTPNAVVASTATSTAGGAGPAELACSV